MKTWLGLLTIVILLTACKSATVPFPATAFPDPKETPAGVVFENYGNLYMDGIQGRMAFGNDGFYTMTFDLMPEFSLQRYTHADSSRISIRVVFSSTDGNPKAELVVALKNMVSTTENGHPVLKMRLTKIDANYRRYVCRYAWFENSPEHP